MNINIKWSMKLISYVSICCLAVEIYAGDGCIVSKVADSSKSSLFGLPAINFLSFKTLQSKASRLGEQLDALPMSSQCAAYVSAGAMTGLAVGSAVWVIKRMLENSTDVPAVQRKPLVFNKIHSSNGSQSMLSDNVVYDTDYDSISEWCKERFVTLDSQDNEIKLNMVIKGAQDLINQSRLVPDTETIRCLAKLRQDQNELDIDEFITVLDTVTCEKKLLHIAQQAVKSNNMMQVVKCLYLQKVSPLAPVVSDGDPGSYAPSILEWYVEREDDGERLSNVFDKISQEHRTYLAQVFIGRKNFDKLMKLKAYGLFDPKRFLFGHIPADKVAQYIELQCGGTLPENELCELTRKVSEQIKGPAISAKKLNRIMLPFEQKYAQAKRFAKYNDAIVCDLTASVLKQNGDECGLHSVRNAVLTARLLQEKPNATVDDIAVVLQQAEQNPQFSIQSLKSTIKLASHLNSSSGENIDENGIDFLMKYLGMEEEDFIVIESMSEFSTDQPWQEKARKALEEFALSNDGIRIVIFKENGALVSLADGTFVKKQPHWTYGVAHKQSGQKLMLYVGDSANPNTGSANEDWSSILAALSGSDDDSNYAFYEVPMSASIFSSSSSSSVSSSSSSSSSTKDDSKGWDHTDPVSVVRLAYLLGLSKDELIAGGKMFGYLDAAQSAYGQGDYSKAYAHMREVIDTAKAHGCLSSDYFYSEYVCDTPKGRGLLHMLRDIQESAQAFGINSVDLDESFALLLEGEGNMNGDVKTPENTKSNASSLLPPISS